MVFVFVCRFVKFGYQRAQEKTLSHSELLRPVAHSLEKVYEPLTSNVVADCDEEDVHGDNRGGEDVIHVGVPGSVNKKLMIKL